MYAIVYIIQAHKINMAKLTKASNCIPPDAVEVVSSAAWLSGAMPCSFMARTSKS